MSCDTLAIANPNIADLNPYQPGKPIAELRREYGITDIIKLASNENPLGPSPKAIAAIKSDLEDLSRYPDGNGFELKQKLANKLSIKSDQITLGNGSNDVLVLAAQAFLTPTDNAIYTQHAFVVYSIAIKVAGATGICAPTKNFGHGLNETLQLINDQTKLIFIPNPNNPTGTWIDKNQLRLFIKTVPDNVIILIDEAYHEYMLAEPDYESTISWVNEFPNLIVTRTFSKIYGLAGLRLGYSVSSPEISDLLNRVRQPFNVNSLALTAACAALDDHDYVQQGLNNNQQGMQQLTEGLTKLGIPYLPPAGNFITIDIQRPANTLFETLLKQGIIVRPLESYQMPNHLRISIGLPEENQRLLQAL